MSYYHLLYTVSHVTCHVICADQWERTWQKLTSSIESCRVSLRELIILQILTHQWRLSQLVSLSLPPLSIFPPPPPPSLTMPFALHASYYTPTRLSSCYIIRIVKTIVWVGLVSTSKVFGSAPNPTLSFELSMYLVNLLINTSTPHLPPAFQYACSPSL